MVSLLRETGLGPAWVVVLPAAIGVVQVLGRVLMYFFEQRFDVHAANRLIPCLIPLALLCLLATAGSGLQGSGPTAGLLFVLLYGLGNGMLTIVKGTAVALYVSPARVGALNGLMNAPSALVRAAGPWVLGVLWSAEAGYRWGLLLALGASLLAIAALVTAQYGAAQKS